MLASYRKLQMHVQVSIINAFMLSAMVYGDLCFQLILSFNPKDSDCRPLTQNAAFQNFLHLKK